MSKQEEILSRIDYKAFYSQYVEDIKHTNGVQGVGKSPFRDDNNPSFSVKFENPGFWKDFATDEGGNVIQFVQKHYGYSFKQALNFLSKFAGMPEIKEKTKTTKPAKVQVLKKDLVNRYAEKLHTDRSEFIDNVLKKRKISLDVCKRFKIGLHVYGDKETLIFPVEFDEEGNAVKHKKHIYENGKCTKKNSLGGSKTLFPAEMLQRDDLILCEGENDCFALISMGFNAVTTNTGATAGISESMRSKFVSKTVTMLFDNDDAGRKGALKSASILYGTAKTVKIADWSEFADFDKPKFDVGDFATGEFETELLEKLIRQSKEYKPVEKTYEEIRNQNVPSGKEIERAKIADEVYETTASGSLRLNQRKVVEYMVANYDVCCTDAGSSRTVYYIYDSGIWKKTSPHRINKLILDLLEHDVSGSKIDSIRKLYSAMVHVQEERFNSRTDLIPLNNCCYDLENLIFIPHSPDHYFTFKNPYDYDESAKCPKFDKSLREYSSDPADPRFETGDDEWIRGFWEITGYCLTGEHEFQKMFWFTGSKGGNGKSTVTRVMQKLTGFELTKPNFDAEKLKGDFYKKDLIGKRLAIAGELPNFLHNLETIKELTGGDWQSTDVKFGDQVYFKNTAKLVFAMNKMPSFPSNAALSPIIRRLYLLPFDFQIKKYEPEIEKTFEGELSGIFNRAIEGLKRLRKNGGFTAVPRAEKEVRRYMRDITLFESFVNDKLHIGDTHADGTRTEIWFQMLWKTYIEYMEEMSGKDWQKDRKNIRTFKRFEYQIKTQFAGKFRTEKTYNTELGAPYVKIFGIGLKNSSDYHAEIDAEEKAKEEIRHEEIKADIRKNSERKEIPF